MQGTQLAANKQRSTTYYPPKCALSNAHNVTFVAQPPFEWAKLKIVLKLIAALYNIPTTPTHAQASISTVSKTTPNTIQGIRLQFLVRVNTDRKISKSPSVNAQGETMFTKKTSIKNFG